MSLAVVFHTRSLSLSQQIRTSGALTFGLARAPHTRLFLRRYFLHFGGVNPSTVSNPSLSGCWQKNWQLALRSSAPSHLRDSTGIIGCLFLRSLEAAALWRLGPSLLFCPPDSPDVSSRVSVLQGPFLLCHVRSWWRLSCVLPLPPGGSSLCEQRPIPSWVHNTPV
jgi:hypothetical protein